MEWIKQSLFNLPGSVTCKKVCKKAKIFRVVRYPAKRVGSIPRVPGASDARRAAVVIPCRTQSECSCLSTEDLAVVELFFIDAKGRDPIAFPWSDPGAFLFSHCQPSVQVLAHNRLL